MSAPSPHAVCRNTVAGRRDLIEKRGPPRLRVAFLRVVAGLPLIDIASAVFPFPFKARKPGVGRTRGHDLRSYEKYECLLFYKNTRFRKRKKHRIGD